MYLSEIDLSSYKTPYGFLSALRTHLIRYWRIPEDTIKLLRPDDERNDVDAWHLVWEGGGPYQWAVSMLGNYTWHGVSGYHENPYLDMDAYWSFSIFAVKRY